MKIRYRSAFTGTFMQTEVARTAKKVTSELVDHGKTVAKVPGFYTSVKKLARKALPPLQKRKRPREYAPPPEPEPDDMDDLIDEWSEDYDGDKNFDTLNAMDDLDEYVLDEDEWYEEA
jgi:hypothetical protein